MSETTGTQSVHVPVLLKEAVDALEVHGEGIYVDATFGGGGHTREILKRGGQVLAWDQDEQVLEQVDETLKENNNLTLTRGNFSEIPEKLTEMGVDTVDGVLFDLGTSAIQLESEGRGFSFNNDEPLDMRMSRDLAVSAKDLVNGLGKKELHALFEKYAQEKRARTVADAIVRARRVKPIETTGELAQIVWQAHGGRKGKLHPATKVFQALRIAVNDELNVLQETLPRIVGRVRVGGRLVVISFHEGEDRIVKQTIDQLEEDKIVRKITRKPIVANESELTRNPRSRSARMRIAEKL